MEVEDDNEILKRLFLQRFGRALPELEKRNEVDDMVNNMDLIDLTKDEDEMEVVTSEIVQTVVVKTEAPEAPEVAPIDNRRRSSRLERLGKSLRKTDVIQEKEAPLAAENVIADPDTDMAEDTSVGSVNAVESVTTGNPKTYEQIMADLDAAIEENTE
jgi:hypothetical protein